MFRGDRLSVLIINRYDRYDISLPNVLLAGFSERNQICGTVTERECNATMFVCGTHVLTTGDITVFMVVIFRT